LGQEGILGIVDHIGLPVTDFDRSVVFYVNALKPLGITLLMQFPPEGPSGGAAAGFGKNGKAELWLGGGHTAGTRVHVALLAESRTMVEDFFDAAIAAGGVDNGAPGVRAHYHADYFGAFVLDPDGHNIEAVCHQPAKA
jgi:catechol 2,3-dioxygenase-like lactoylglutathione lyase family enzyme